MRPRNPDASVPTSVRYAEPCADVAWRNLAERCILLRLNVGALGERLVEDHVGAHHEAARAARKLGALAPDIRSLRQHFERPIDAGEEGVGGGGRTLVRDVGSDVEQVITRKRRTKDARRGVRGGPLSSRARVAKEFVERLERSRLAAQNLRPPRCELRRDLVVMLAQELVDIGIRVRYARSLRVGRLGVDIDSIP